MTAVNNEPNGVVRRFASKGVFPHQMAFTLLIPLRRIFLSPEELIKRLELKEDQSVLEIGPGPGFFSTHIAERLNKGKLVLADIQDEMLKKSKKRIDKQGLRNVEYNLLNGNNLDFPDQSFDRVFMVTVLGEIENKENYIKEIGRILKSDGLLSISELAGDPDRMSINQIKELVIPYGLKFIKQFGNKRNYTINFIKT